MGTTTTAATLPASFLAQVQAAMAEPSAANVAAMLKAVMGDRTMPRADAKAAIDAIAPTATRKGREEATLANIPDHVLVLATRAERVAKCKGLAKYYKGLGEDYATWQELCNAGAADKLTADPASKAAKTQAAKAAK